MFAAGLRSRGYKKGDRIIWLAPLSPATYYFTIACLLVGVVPVFIEGGLPTHLLKKCIRQAKAKAIVSSKALYRYLVLFPEIWHLKKYSVDSESALTPFEALRGNQGLINPVELSPDEVCLLTFTTGSTGTPKAAERTLKCLTAQHELSQKYWPENELEVDMPVFPNVVFQNLLCGITTVLPNVDFHKLKEINPGLILQQILQDQVTRLSGSPKYLEQLCDYILANSLETPVRNLIVGGAPVCCRLAHKIQQAFPQSKNYVVYGSTEVEPIAFSPLESVCLSTESGYFVGQPLSEIQIRICDPQSEQSSNEGEVWVSGPHVVEKYFQNDVATKATKVRDKNGLVWHRTGDWGRTTPKGIVLLGRVSDLLIWENHHLANYIIEAELEDLESVERAGVLQNKNRIEVCLQKTKGKTLDPRLLEKILEKFQLERARIHFFDELPVDPRHNSKIDRKSLRSLLLP